MKKVVSLMLALCIAVGLAACGAAQGEGASGAVSADAKTIKIGGIGPVTGGAAVYGNAVKNGAELAVKEINAAGGVQFYFQFPRR